MTRDLSMANQFSAGGEGGYSDFIVYADESGTHNLDAVEAQFPVFVLSLCLFRKADYVATIVPGLQRLKMKWFGHDMVVLHERDIRKQTAPFAFLTNRERRERFMADLNAWVEAAPMTVIAAVIDKARLKDRECASADPYDLALTFCLERLWSFLGKEGAQGARTHCVFERRGKAEDRALELTFRRVADGHNHAQAAMPGLSIIFADKKVNSTGLQLADLTARPIGLGVVRPGQPNRALDLIRLKMRAGAGESEGAGPKLFP